MQVLLNVNLLQQTGLIELDALFWEESPVYDATKYAKLQENDNYQYHLVGHYPKENSKSWL